MSKEHLLQKEIMTVLADNNVRLDIDVPQEMKKVDPPFSANTWLNVIIAAAKPLVCPVAYNFIRDFTWAPLTQHSTSYNGQSNVNDSNDQIYGQWLYSTVAMLSLFTLKFGMNYFIHKCKGLELSKELKHDMYTDTKIILGASIALYGWDQAAMAATNYYLQQGYDAIPAGYYAAWSPGLVEGPTQYMVPKIIDGIVDLLTTREGLKNFFKDSSTALKTVMKLTGGVLINGSFGAIPGDVWQLVYNRCIEWAIH